MFGRNKAYAYTEACEKSCPDTFGGAYELASAIRQVATTQEPSSGPQQVLLAVEGTIVNERDVPANVRIIYYKADSPTPTFQIVGY